MRTVRAIVTVILVWVSALGFVESSAWANGGPDEQIQDYIRQVDLGLSPAEELALKREFGASGALDRLRMEGKSALTEEENRIYAYLTRPVRAKDEANPKGQRPIISGSCSHRAPWPEVRALFLSHGLTFLREWDGLLRQFYYAEAPQGIDAVRLAREMRAEVETRWPGAHLLASPLALLADAQVKEGGPAIYVAKNRVYCSFTKPLGAQELSALCEAEGLVLQAPRVAFECVDSAWTTDHATCFIADSSTVGEVVDRLFDREEVKYANVDGWATLDGYVPPRENPSDENYSSIPSVSQWYFLQDRDANGSDSDDDDSRDFDVDAAEGWYVETGSSTSIVAIIDAGFKLDHDDLLGRWWVNPGEIAGDNIDNEPNGIVDDINGVDLDAMTGVIPSHWHGTAVAGIIGALTNGGGYGAGSSWNCRLMALRFNDKATAEARNAQTRLGIGYARNKGAKVINMSIGNNVQDADLEAGIDSAYASGIVLVAAAGNQHNDPSDDPHYPGDYESVLEVAGSSDDNRRYFTGTPPSTQGSGWGTGDLGPDLCAPAEDMFLLCDGSVGTTEDPSPCAGQLWVDGVSGTSFSTPIVSGLAALVMDQYGLQGQADAVVRILKGAVDDVHGDVTDEQNSSSEPHPGPDDLGAGRVNFFKALAPPRLQTVILTQEGYTRFNEGDLNGNSVFNWMDEDIDGDSFRNSADDNDDGDEFMDGPDVDMDGDGAWDEADTNYVLRQEIEPGDLDVWVMFNETMVGDTVAIDPSVKLILPDGSELVFASVGSGNDDWGTQWVANDLWHGRVTVTEDDIAKMYGDLRLEISGSADMAGEALDWDLETPGAQGYVYPLHMPGFVASASDPHAGVAKNTTALGEGVWPMAWGVVDVVGRGFNTDAGDPLSVQSMGVTIERGYDDQTVVSSAPMTQTGSDFRYEWDTVADGDSEYEVTLQAYDGSSGSKEVDGGVDGRGRFDASCRHPAQMVGIRA